MATAGRFASAHDEATLAFDLGLVQLTGASTKREVVDIALRRLVEKGSLYRSLRRLKGKIEWEGDVAAWRSARAASG